MKTTKKRTKKSDAPAAKQSRRRATTKTTTKSRRTKSATIAEKSSAKEKTQSQRRPISGKVKNVPKATRVKKTQAPTEKELIAALQCLSLPVPTKESAEHELISFVQQHHSLVQICDRTSSIGQWRAGDVLNLLYKIWHPKYTKNLNERTTVPERSALDYRDFATYLSEAEASQIAPGEARERIKKIKDDLRKGLTHETLQRKCKELEDKSLGLRQLVETDDRFALKCFFDEPSDSVRVMDKCLPLIAGITSNAISIGKALQAFKKDLKELAK